MFLFVAKETELLQVCHTLMREIMLSKTQLDSPRLNPIQPNSIWLNPTQLDSTWLNPDQPYSTQLNLTQIESANQATQSQKYHIV